MNEYWIAILVGVLCCSLCGAHAGTARKSVQLTVYNSNFALVKDVRSVKFTKGIFSYELEDVAAKIDPTSVLFKSLTAPNSVVILEQNYQYDLISPDNILNKSVGERITFTRFNERGEPITDSGILLNPPQNGGITIRTDSGTIVLNPSGQISLQKMPEGLHPRPTLSWLLQCDRDGEQETEISYITDGINWRADYVALVNQDDNALDISGWVTLTNESGASYENAKLTLMAGDVRRLRERRLDRYDEDGKPIVMELSKDQFEEKPFFEYHMYAMERPTTIRNNETKQLSLLNASNVKVIKEMIYDGRGDWWRAWWYPGRTGHPGRGYDTSDYHKVNIVLEFQNSKENHMGMPLPKGKVRVYKLDDTGSIQFIGEDTIDHTPKDEKVRLYIGDAFDVVGEYKRTNYERIADKTIEESFEVKIRNHKASPVEVKVIDHVWSDWKVVKSSHEYTKKDAHTIEFPVNVPKDGEVKVTYTIRTSW
ncbi:MAG: DUF4139 domain-containing protein [Armatimonadota bacterium]|nr:DUF4139 domain-containing protein [Armatimonadota bacterium]